MKEDLKTEGALKRWLRCIVRFWREMRRSEPCVYCGKATGSRNVWGEFRHFECFQEALREREAAEKQEAENRRQIELYKTAMREVRDENKEYTEASLRAIGAFSYISRKRF